MNTLRTRLWLTYTLVVGVALGVVTLGVLTYLWRNPLAYREASLELRLAAAEVAARSNALVRLDADRREALLRRVADAIQGRVVLVNADGSVLADSHPDQPAFWPWPLPKPSQRLSFRVPRQGIWLYYTRPLTANVTVLVLRPRPPVTPWHILTDDLLPVVCLAAVLALVLALLLAWLVARWVAAPLQQMAEAAIAVAEGRGQPIPVQGPEEVRLLAHAFNDMLARVRDTLRSQRDFVANVSHELKTPLTAIQGFAQALLDGTAAQPEARQQAAQIILDEAGRMHRLVVDLLDLARLDAGMLPLRREPVSLSALLRSVVEKFAPLSQQNHVTLTLEADDLPPLLGDRDRLAQVFTNLVDNALQHTPAGGQVTVRVTRHGEEAWVAVSDSGPGIPPEEQPRIFERFYRLDKSRRGGRRHGAGLGLSIASELVQAHGGRIDLSSSPGQGSVFVVKLPFVRPDDSTLSRRRTQNRAI